MEYIFIVNGRKDKASIRTEVERQLNVVEVIPSYEIYVTKGPGDATQYVFGQCVDRPDDEICFVACGGDGTLNEVACGIMKAGHPSGKKLAVFATGSANDFIKYYKGKDFHSVEALLKATEHKIDILKVGDRYSINVINFGFDSIVGRVGNKLSEKGWKNPYRYGIIAAIFTGRFNRIDVVADGVKIGGKRMLLCTLANNHYVGGDFFCAPRARNNDGLIDVCLMKITSLLSFLHALPVYVAGRHLDDPKHSKKFIYRQAKHVEVSARHNIDLCLDGEMVSGTHFEIDIIPGAISLMVP